VQPRDDVTGDVRGTTGENDLFSVSHGRVLCPAGRGENCELGCKCTIDKMYDIPNVQYDIPNVQYDIPNVQYDIPNVEYDIPNVQYDIPNVQYDKPNVQYDKSDVQ